MSDDPFLSSALRALRDDMGGQRANAERTRREILARERRRALNRRRAVLTVTAFAAVLCAAAAWAALSGRSRPERSGSLSPLHSLATSGQTPRATVQPTTAGRSPPLRSPASESAPSPVSTRQAASVLSAPTATALDSAASAREASARSHPRATPSTSVSPEEQAKYDVAHAAHFAQRDPESALLGWDAYLAAYPHGRFAQEAAYNRAIALVRLGRRAEARAALAPFASGAYSGYRQREARELVNALTDDTADGGAP